jgi:rhodanese-related sulfurtransferase
VAKLSHNIVFAEVQKFLLPLFCGVLLATLAIYLSPLKHLNLVEPTIHDVDPREFYTAYQANPEQYLFIDVRPNAGYNKIHAVDSTNIELHQMYNERHNLPKTGKTIVLICSGGIASGVAYGYLEHYGFLNLQRVQGGIENWIAEDLPVVTQPLI